MCGYILAINCYFYVNIVSLSENIAKSFKGATFLTHTVQYSNGTKSDPHPHNLHLAGKIIIRQLDGVRPCRSPIRHPSAGKVHFRKTLSVTLNSEFEPMTLISVMCTL